MASFQYGSNCYSSALATAQAAASSQIGALVPIGSVVYSVDVLAVSDTSITYKLTDLNSTAALTKSVPFTALPCGLLDTSDGLIIGWGIATAWLVTAGILFLRKGMNV
jgi:hypothetical protein